MIAKKHSYLKLPVDQYELTAEDVLRAKEEKARGMVAPQHPVLSKTARTMFHSEMGRF